MINEEFEKFKNHKSVKKWSVDVFDKTKWLDGAWGTLKRTLVKSPDHKKNKKLYTTLRKEFFKNIFDETFGSFPNEIDKIDLWYKKIITKEYKLPYLSIGQKQKMVNILIKYFLTYFHTTKDTDKDFCKRFNKNISHIHIPIDKVVLESIFKNETYRKKFQNRITTTNRTSNQYFWDSKPWSKINDYESYFNFQKTVRNLSKIEGMSPIEFEMKKLWS